MDQLFDLWSDWRSGDQLGGARLWGWPVLAWGRFGKLLQFVAGLTVLLDLIGLEKLQAVGRRLQANPWQRFAAFAERYGIIITSVAMIGCMGTIFLFPAVIGSTLFAIITMLVFLAVGYLLTPQARETISRSSRGDRERRRSGRGGLYSRLRELKAGNMSPAVAVELSVTVSFLLVVALPVLLWLGIVHGVALPITRRLANLLDREKPLHPLRWVAFGLFVIGFHFDLLAS